MSDATHMAHALALGRRGLGNVWPNPAVGCVIVAGGRIVGRGFTRPGGRPHAEVVALAQAGPAARGATAYVTLEPCAHHGVTPPCSDALIAAGVARVVVALGDPDPRVNGGGIARLRAAGVAVTTGVGAVEARHDQRGFLSRITRGRPMVTLKLATSLDGRIATAGGESRWITAPPARRMVHAMRARHDAVMVGGGTARADDPMLDVRGLGIVHQPVRVILSRGLDLPLNGRLAATAGQIPLWLCHGPDIGADLAAKWAATGARLIACPLDGAGQLQAAGVLAALGAAGITRVFCEGGGQVAASLLAADLVDELAVFGAGLALGADGRAAVGAMGIAALAAAPRFHLRDVLQVGPDVLHHWVRAD